MPRDTTLARIVVISTVAVAATAIGLSVASSGDRKPSAGKQHLAASAQTSTAPLPQSTTVAAGTVLSGAGSSATTSAPAVPLTTAPTAPPVRVLAPVTTAAPATAPVTARPPVVTGGGIAIGDSVLEDVALYAPATLSARGVVINAAVSRQWGAGETIVATLRASGRLPAVVVVALGSNGPISSVDFDKMMSGLAGVRRVVFMTVTGPLIANNDVIRAGVARYPQAVLADWASLAAANPTWFARDHVHVGAAGATALGQLFASVI